MRAVAVGFLGGLALRAVLELVVATPSLPVAVGVGDPGPLLRGLLLAGSLVTLGAASASFLVVRDRKDVWMLVAMGCAAFSLLLPLPSAR